MKDLSFKLDAFEGPLDLLLFLVTKHKLNIEDIEISLLLEQYLAYIDKIPEKDLESAGDFLEMAARLIYIKTVSLLPTYEEAEVMKKELEGRLIEYSLCKKAAARLLDVYCGSDVFVRQQVKLDVDKSYNVIHNPEDLLVAYSAIASRVKNQMPPSPSEFRPIISKRIVSVTTKIIYILKKLYNGGKYDMSCLYDGVTDKSEKIATFLAVLELTKSGRVHISDDNREITFTRKNKEITV